MGWKVNKIYDNNPAGDCESFNTYKLTVTGNSISDTICFEQNGTTICMQDSVLQEIVTDLIKQGVLHK